MRIPAALAGMALIAAAAPAGAGQADGEAALAKLTAGRVAGKPQSCISSYGAGSSRIIDGTAIVYGNDRSRIWVNRPRSGAQELGGDVILVWRSPSSSICSGDAVDLIDRNSRMNEGFVILGDFVPYDRRH